MTARADEGIAIENIDRIPASKALTDLDVGLVVRVAQGAKRFLGEHDAPTEGGIRRVTFDHADLHLRIGLLCQQREVEAGGAAAEDGVLHRG